MLAGLSIRNVVLIEQLDIQFSQGFCALTGETGAGKSILLDSLGLALGGRSDSGLVRKGAEQASVAAEFQIQNEHAIHALLKEQGLESDRTVILRRTLGRDGRSRAFINDQPVSVGLLRQAGDVLVEVHSQFETHGLLDPKTHRGLLDEYAGLQADVKSLAGLWRSYREAEAALSFAVAEAEKAKKDEEYLRFAVDELQKLDPLPGEEEQILIQREALKHKDQVLTGLNETWDCISGDDGAEMSINRAARAIGRVADKIGTDITPVIDALNRAGNELQDAVSRVQVMISAVEGGGLSLEVLEDRLYALRGMARKHHAQVDQLPALLQDLAQKLSLITEQDDILAGLQKNLSATRAAYLSAAQKLSAARIKAAASLDKAVAKELPPLKLDKARFITAVTGSAEEKGWGVDGIDDVRFLVATNPGAEPAALGKIASGGEMARFMLAIKVVMAATGQAASLVFDEVDSGIGGSTADAVGERLARLAETKQILVVTHSPQVAARAAHHWIVMKAGASDVKTTVVPLPELKQRQEEIARMLSGATITKEARAAAQKLLDTGT
ncbi:MAG: repair protein RecN [Micavibrio sp.]|nr:repair protein RecN [Micavibrio sp.]